MCSTGCLQLPNYTKNALLEEAKGLLEDAGDEVAVIGFFDDNISYTAADNAGTARLHYPTNMMIVRTPSTAVLDKEIILKTLGLGADGVMIWEVEESHEAELAEKLVAEVKEELAGMGVAPERVTFRPMVLPIFKVLPKFVSDFVDVVKKMGKIPDEAREKLLE